MVMSSWRCAWLIESCWETKTTADTVSSWDSPVKGGVAVQSHDSTVLHKNTQLVILCFCLSSRKMGICLNWDDGTAANLVWWGWARFTADGVLGCWHKVHRGEDAWADSNSHIQSVQQWVYYTFVWSGLGVTTVAVLVDIQPSGSLYGGQGSADEGAKWILVSSICTVQ